FGGWSGRGSQQGSETEVSTSELEVSTSELELSTSECSSRAVVFALVTVCFSGRVSKPSAVSTLIPRVLRVRPLGWPAESHGLLFSRTVRGNKVLKVLK